MIELDMTGMINKLCEGTATAKKQKVCGIVLKSMIQNNSVKPNYNVDGRPYCPNCDQPINTKMKNGKHIYEYCKCCGQKIDWEVSE